MATKYNVVEAAFRVADRALDLSGGFGMFKKSELERLFRDARAGRFHPANSALAHELVAKMTLGINPDEQPELGITVPLGLAVTETSERAPLAYR